MTSPPSQGAGAGQGAGTEQGAGAEQGTGAEQGAGTERDGPTPALDTHVAPHGGEEVGEAPSFEAFPYPTSYGRPDRASLERALWAYILGHDRGWEAERKREQAEARLAREKKEAPRGVRERPSAGRREPSAAELREPPPAEADTGPEDTSASLAGAMREDLPEAGIRQARFGVPVPERLDFHRGPDTWRDRIRRRGEGSRR